MKSFLSEIREKIKAKFESETIFGSPLELSSMTIIPVARVTGKKTARDEKTDSDYNKSPVGYIEIRGERVRFIPLYDTFEILLLGALAGAGVALLANIINKKVIKPILKEKQESETSLYREKNMMPLLCIAGVSTGALLAGLVLRKYVSVKTSDFESMYNPPAEETDVLSKKKKAADDDWNKPEIVEINEPLEELLKGEHSSSDDDALIERFKKGDLSAFEMIFERYRQPIFNFLFHMLQDKAMAEDIFQEVFYKILKNLDAYRCQEKFSHYIYKIANNTAIDYLRKQKKTKEFPFFSPGDGREGIERLEGSPDEEPDKIYELKESGEVLKKAIRSLPVEQRQVLLLREYFGLSFKNISKMLGCPLNTALGRMHYALRNLRKYFDKSGIDSGEKGKGTSSSKIGGLMFYGV